MSVNHKLTNIVKDRVVQNLHLNAPELLITFVDGSTVTINIVESNSDYRLMYDKSNGVNSGSATAGCILF
jgi:hypothetical protein